MTDHEQTALTALVAWREAGAGVASKPKGKAAQVYVDRFVEAISKLRAATDLVIAERAAAVGR